MFYEIFEDIEGFDEMMVIIEFEEINILLLEDDEEFVLLGLDIDFDRINEEELENL